MKKISEHLKMKKHKLPALYELDGKKDALYRVRLFLANGFEWYLLEYDPVQKLAFGFANLNDPEMAELGYISIAELEELNVPIKVIFPDGSVKVSRGRGQKVEIDEHYEPLNLEQIKKRVRKGY